MSIKPILFFLGIAMSGYAQVLKFDRAYEVGAAFGGERMVFDELGEEDWNKLTPNYESNKFIDTSFKQSSTYMSYGGAVGSLFFSFALKQPTENETSLMIPMLRFSLNTSSGFRSDIFYNKERSYVYDSAILYSTGAVTYLDSTVNYDFRKSYYSTATNLMTNLLFHGNRNKRWSFYLGFGLGFGLGVNAMSTSSMDRFIEMEYIDDSEESQDFDSESIFYETFKRKNYFIYHFNVPIGVDFRIRNNDKFYGRSVLSLEAQFGANWMRIPEVTNTQNTSFRFMFAYKYRL